ncbi:iron-sulfur cluster assembly protein [Sphingopyxis sp. FD7]|uniref:iron-sulfur cluster assembly protein n=1 Tax=Sphingopyxis sp. FD7 TaxID=1914525 RepID=UPI000DC627EC|nr:iron-sulfur cluster assembly protein [Sphingopyxis sp. FD7]BBB14396.1 hypothetical protein SPYCA_3654 [Sphingopyxis sp. FD7]
MHDLEGLIRRELDTIKDPCSIASGVPLGLDEMGLIDRIDIVGAAVTVYLRLTSPFCHMIGFFHVEAARLLGAIDGIETVQVIADNGLDWTPSLISAKAQRLRSERILAMADGLSEPA